MWILNRLRAPTEIDKQGILQCLSSQCINDSAYLTLYCSYVIIKARKPNKEAKAPLMPVSGAFLYFLALVFIKPMLKELQHNPHLAKIITN